MQDDAEDAEAGAWCKRQEKVAEYEEDLLGAWWAGNFFSINQCASGNFDDGVGSHTCLSTVFAGCFPRSVRPAMPLSPPFLLRHTCGETCFNDDIMRWWKRVGQVVES